uniref:Putative ovule protein n=1 Tax=Solanum chacoense TaxID=4108 RepID=A0A0V0H854_SOLCH
MVECTQTLLLPRGSREVVSQGPSAPDTNPRIFLLIFFFRSKYFSGKTAVQKIQSEHSKRYTPKFEAKSN